MKKLNIDLGKGYEDSMPSVKDMKEEMSYPSFHVDGDKELNLPDEGTMLIHFKKKEETSRMGEDGDKHYSCQIQVKEIISVEADVEAPSKSHAKESDDALDELASKIKHKMEKEY